MIRLYENDPRDLYVQLADQIIQLIAEKKLEQNDELPSVRQLASQLRVNPKTVQSAYQRLAEKGFIQLRHKARAIVNLTQLSNDEWLTLWRPEWNTFIGEAKARGLSRDQALECVTKWFNEQEEIT